MVKANNRVVKFIEEDDMKKQEVIIAGFGVAKKDRALI